MLFAFHLFKLQCCRRDFDGKMDFGCVWRGIEERRLHRSADVALHLAGCASLQVFLDGIAGQKIGRPGITVAASRADRGTSAVHFDFYSVATAFIGNRGLYTRKGNSFSARGEPAPARREGLWY